MQRFVLMLLLAACAPIPALAMEAQSSSAFPLDVRAFHPVEGPNAGPAVYYRVVEDPGGALLRGTYEPGMQSVTMGVEVPERLRRARVIRWEWRARAVPADGDECRTGRGDSAASVSLAFRRGWKWYVLKFVWSGASPLGAVCDRTRSPFLARDTVVLERGSARDGWLREVVDVRQAFIDHFAGGDPAAEVPDLVGIGVMTDGDQTSSQSGADWAGFELLY